MGDEEETREIAMVKGGRSIYDERTDAKHYAGLMTLDQIKSKRSRIESGEEFENQEEKAARAAKIDAAVAKKEAEARAQRMAAKKEKEKKELEQLEGKGEVDAEVKEEGAPPKKKKAKKKAGTALSFNQDEEDG